MVTSQLTYLTKAPVSCQTRSGHMSNAREPLLGSSLCSLLLDLGRGREQSEAKRGEVPPLPAATFSRAFSRAFDAAAFLASCMILKHGACEYNNLSEPPRSSRMSNHPAQAVGLESKKGLQAWTRAEESLSELLLSFEWSNTA